MNLSWNQLAENCFASCRNAFGEVFTLTYASGEKMNAVGIFTQTPLEIDEGVGTRISTSHFTSEVRLNDLLGRPNAKDQIEIRGVKYRILEIKEDHSGNIILLLTLESKGPQNA